MQQRNSATIFQQSTLRKSPAIIIGTGPSLDIDEVKKAQQAGCALFGINNTFNDFELDVWLACDPYWHQIYSPVQGRFDKWHWDKSICEKHNYFYIEGRWGNGPNKCDGLSLDSSYIAYGHSSGFQALGLAVHYGCSPIYLTGYDMHYGAPQRHYFASLSNAPGEYPKQLRKYSAFDGLLLCYEQVAKQQGLPPIYNATLNSALKCFPYRPLPQ